MQWFVMRHVIEGRLTLTEVTERVSLPGIWQMNRLVDAYNAARAKLGGVE